MQNLGMEVPEQTVWTHFRQLLMEPSDQVSCFICHSTDTFYRRSFDDKISFIIVQFVSFFFPWDLASVLESCITKTYLYNFDPLKPHFYIVKLGFTGVYIIFLISAQKHRLWVLVRTALARRF